MMCKRISQYAIIFLISGIIYCQTGLANPKTESSLFGVQTGAIGLWVYHEAGLTENLVLRSEIGIDMVDFFRNDVYLIDPKDTGGGPFFTPTLALEPRYYFNFSNRAKSGKSTVKNSATFVSIDLRYYPDWFLIVGNDNSKFAEQLAITPRIGIKRTVWEHFTYEIGFGMRLYSLLDNKDNNAVEDNEYFLNTLLRVGYSF